MRRPTLPTSSHGIDGRGVTRRGQILEHDGPRVAAVGARRALIASSWRPDHERAADRAYLAIG